ncbi:Hypothetical predicted protein, partial [Marmota monax]
GLSRELLPDGLGSPEHLGQRKVWAAGGSTKPAAADSALGPVLELARVWTPSLQGQRARARPHPHSCAPALAAGAAGRVNFESWDTVGEMEIEKKLKPTPDYLMQLMNNKKQLSSLLNFCGIFNAIQRLVDEKTI